MTRTAARVIARMIPVLILVSIATALLVDLVPGDPAVAILGPEASAEQYDQIRQSLGLDQSIFVRYADWLSSMMRGDMGQTLVPPIQDVSTLIASRLPVTLEIAFLSVFVALAISIPAGMWSAYRYEKGFDRIASGLSFSFISMPSFLLALLVIYFFVFRPDAVKGTVAAIGVIVALIIGLGAFGKRSTSLTTQQRKNRIILAASIVLITIAISVFLPDFPRQGYSSIASDGLLENLRTLFLPVLVLALIESAQLTRLLRSDMVATLNEDFILAARAKGMPVRHILVKEALRPSSFSLVTVAGISFGRLLGGTVIVETIFRVPGMGTLIVDSVAKKEFLVLQSAVLVIAFLYVLVNALIDLSYLYLDPRTRHAHV